MVLAMLSSAVTEIKSRPQLAMSPGNTEFSCMFLLLAAGKMAIPLKKCEVINTLTLVLKFLYQGWLLPSCPEPIILLTVAVRTKFTIKLMLSL